MSPPQPSLADDESSLQATILESLQQVCQHGVWYDSGLLDYYNINVLSECFSN